MTDKFDKLYENIQIGFPISVQNPSREVYGTVGTDMGKELNDEFLANIQDLIHDNGKIINQYHPASLKVRYYKQQLERLSREDLVKGAEMLGFEFADQHDHQEVVDAMVNLLGNDPENWKKLNPLIFTESEDDSSWITMKSQMDYYEEDEDPCWDNYEMVGMKDKGGKRVPNCVPKEACDDELEEKIVVKKVVRDGKVTKIKKTDDENKKIVDGKEVRMDRAEKKRRHEAAEDREKRNTNIGAKRQNKFKKSIKVKRDMKRRNNGQRP